jgi:hypothetical protein
LAATSVTANGAGSVLGYQVPTGRAGAIWGGGDGPVVDASGNILVATGNSDATSTFDYGDAVLKLSPATSPPINLLDWFAPSNWSQLNSADLDLGSTEPVTLNANYLFQIGKEGVGYVLNTNNLGHIGGQAYSAQVCNGGGAFGGPAYFNPYVIIPCSNGLVALQVNLGSSPSFTVLWRGPSYLAGPPIIGGNAVWDVDAGSGVLYAFALTSGQILFHDTIGSVPTHFNSLSAGDGQIFVSASRQVRAYLPPAATMTLTTAIVGSGSVNPSCPSGCAEQVGASISVTATAASGYVFSSWSVTGASCSGGASGNPCQFTMPNNPVTVSADFIRPTNTTLTVSPNSIVVGLSVSLSGSISPDPGIVPVSITVSQDAGATWSFLMSVSTDGSGAYSASWAPPAPGNYLLKANWSGNTQFAASQSSSASLTVTGSVQPYPTVLLSAPSSVPHGQLVTLSVTVFNPRSQPLTANVTVQIVGPNNYVVFDVLQIRANANSQLTYLYDWAVPSQPGSYTITVSLLPSRTGGGVDTDVVQVT